MSQIIKKEKVKSGIVYTTQQLDEKQREQVPFWGDDPLQASKQNYLNDLTNRAVFNVPASDFFNDNLRPFEYSSKLTNKKYVMQDSGSSAFFNRMEFLDGDDVMVQPDEGDAVQGLYRRLRFRQLFDTYEIDNPFAEELFACADHIREVADSRFLTIHHSVTVNKQSAIQNSTDLDIVSRSRVQQMSKKTGSPTHPLFFFDDSKTYSLSSYDSFITIEDARIVVAVKKQGVPINYNKHMGLAVIGDFSHGLNDMSNHIALLVDTLFSYLASPKCFDGRLIPHRLALSVEGEGPMSLNYNSEVGANECPGLIASFIPSGCKQFIASKQSATKRAAAKKSAETANVTVELPLIKAREDIADATPLIDQAQPDQQGHVRMERVESSIAESFDKYKGMKVFEPREPTALVIVPIEEIILSVVSSVGEFISEVRHKPIVDEDSKSFFDKEKHIRLEAASHDQANLAKQKFTRTKGDSRGNFVDAYLLSYTTI